MLEHLYQVLGQYINLSEEDKQLFATTFEPLEVAPATILDHLGNVPQQLYFVHTGIVRSFYYNDKGEEANTQLVGSGSWITSFLDFIHQSPSKETLQSLTHCQLLSISHQQLRALIDKNERFKAFSLVIFEQALKASQERAKELANLTAEQRYKKWVEQVQDWLPLIPIRHVASYLGIKPESLSRIRRHIKQQSTKN